MLFFGKVLTDSRSRGPFRLGELRGFRYNAEAAPAEEMIEPAAVSYTTQRVARSQLSSEEWSAPERDRMVQALLADEATGQAPPIPPAAFEHEAR